MRIRHSIIFILLSLVIVTTPCFAIQITSVKPLFEITADFNSPSDVSVSPDNRIYVIDGVNNQVKIFSYEGKFLSSFGEKGTGKGEFNFPLGFDIGESGTLYVADSGNHRIQIFTPTGEFISELKIPDGYRKPADPTDIAVDENNNKCHIADNNNHRVLTYELTTHELLASHGEPGIERLEFRFPFLIALDRDSNFCVVDVLNTRVQVLNPDGKFIASVGNWGVEKGQFFRPKGVAVDRENKMYVSDSYMGVVQVFTARGVFYSAIGDNTNGVKKFNSPVGLYVDKNDRLYVVEMYGHKVSVFALGEAVRYIKPRSSISNAAVDTPK